MWGGYTLMHEWGHFAYELFDEYQNDDAACDSDDPGGPCQCEVHWENGGPTVPAAAATPSAPGSGGAPPAPGASGAHPIPTLGHLPLLLLSGLLGLLAIRRYAVFMKR